MVNSKKMSKSSIAVIVLSILLVLSMILGLTGAWFTDKTNGQVGNKPGVFGTVSLTESPGAWAAGEWTNTNITYAKESYVMPGSKLSIDGGTVTNSGTVSAYVLVSIEQVKVTVTGSDGEIDISAYVQKPTFQTTSEEVEKTADPKTVYEGMYLVAKDGTIEFTAGLVEISNTLPDEVSNKAVEGASIAVTYKVVVRAVQAANNTAGDAYTYLTTDSNWAA